MSGLKKSLRAPASPKEDFLYASFDQSDVEMQRNRSNSEIGAGHKVMSRPKKTTKERSGMRRHTTDKTDLSSAPRPSLLTTLLEAQIAEAEESPKGRRIPTRTPKITEWSERLFYRRRGETARKSLVILLYEGVIWAGPPASPTSVYRDLLLPGLTLLQQHCQVAVLLHSKDNWVPLDAIAREHVDAIYSSRNTESIGAGKKVWMQNYSQLLEDFDTTKAVVVSCLSLSNDEYEGKAEVSMMAEPFNGSWQFHV